MNATGRPPHLLSPARSRLQPQRELNILPLQLARASIRCPAAGVPETGPGPKRGSQPDAPLPHACGLREHRAVLHFVAVFMVPPVYQEPSIMPINTRTEKELEEKVLCTHKKPKATGCVAQPQQEIELAIESENKGHGDPSPKESACVVLSNGEANGCSGANEEPEARSRLAQLCSAIGWKSPTYEFQEHGHGHTKLFTCKVSVLVETFTDTVVECISEPKPQKRAAQEQGAEGVLWTLKRLGHVK
uniref:DRBM domain-containing protein n=2 Tax=Triticum urartu TaxID=4572 RepID=A0A8R7UJ84_TRIUA